MTKTEAIEYFKTQAKLADALGLKQPTISTWKNGIPPMQQLAIEKITRGALKADPEVWAMVPTPADQQPADQGA